MTLPDNQKAIAGNGGALRNRTGDARLWKIGRGAVAGPP
jgi:hypothetical protein